MSVFMKEVTMKRTLKRWTVVLMSLVLAVNIATVQTTLADEDDRWLLEEVDGKTKAEISEMIIRDGDLLNQWANIFNYLLAVGGRDNPYRNEELNFIQEYNNHIKTIVHVTLLPPFWAYSNRIIRDYLPSVYTTSPDVLYANLNFADTPEAALRSAMNEYHDNLGNDVIWRGILNQSENEKLQNEYIKRFQDLGYLPSVEADNVKDVIWTWSYSGLEDALVNPVMTRRDMYKDVIIFYDFKVDPITEVETPQYTVGEALPELNEEHFEAPIIYTEGTQTQKSTVIVENPNYETIEVSKEFTYSITKEITQEVAHSIEFGSTTTIEAGLELSIPEVEGVKGTISGSQSFSLSANESWTNGKAFVNTEEVKDTINVPLPPHTTIMINEKYGTNEVIMPYNAGASVSYKVAIIKLNGFDNVTVLETNLNRMLGLNFEDYPLYGMQAYPFAVFGRNNGSAYLDLQERINQSKNIDIDTLDWTYLSSNLISQITQGRIPYLPESGTFTYVETGTTITPDQISPLYDLARIIPRTSSITMYIDESYDLESITVDAYNAYDVPYYGFVQRNAGHWIVVDEQRNPDESIASIEDGLNGKVLTPKSSGTTYLQYITGESLGSVGSYLIPVEIRPQLLTDILLSGSLEPIYLNDTNNIVSLANLDVSGLDSEGNEAAPTSLVFKTEERLGAEIDNNTQEIHITDPGTYHIYAIANGDESNRITLTVYPERRVESLTVEGSIPELEWYDPSLNTVNLLDVLTILAVDQYGDPHVLADDELQWILGSSGTGDVRNEIISNRLIALSDGLDTLSLVVDGVQSTPMVFNNKEKPYLNNMSVNGEIPDLIWDDPAKSSLDLTQVLNIHATDQYGEVYPLSDSDLEWIVASTDTSDVKAMVNGNILTGLVVGSDTVLLKVGDHMSDPLAVTIKASPYMNELHYIGSAPLIEPGIPYDLNQVSLYAIDQYKQRLELTDFQRKNVEWQVDPTSEIEAVIDNGMLNLTEEISSGNTSTVTLSATLAGNVKTCTASNIIITVKAPSVLSHLTVIPPEGLELKLNENANLSTFTLIGYDQYGDEFPVNPDEAQWSSSDASVVEVTEICTIVGKEIDQPIQLTATIGSVVSDPVTIMIYGVREYSALSIQGAPYEVKNNASLNISELSLQASDQYGRNIPLDELSGSAQWSIDAGITKADLTDGVIRFGNVAGEVTLYAWLEDSNSHQVDDVIGTANITVQKPVIVTPIGGRTPTPVLEIIEDDGIALAGEFSGFSGYWDDVPESYWAYDAIMALSELGMLDGRTDVLYEPELAITRAEFASYMVNVMGIYDGQATDNFKDVEASNTYAQHIASAYATGLINGYSETEFRPDLAIKRQEIVSILIRAWSINSDLASLEWYDPGFLDMEQVDDYAKESVFAAAELGFIIGYDVEGGKEFRPQNNMTRAEAATILNRFYRSNQK